MPKLPKPIRAPDLVPFVSTGHRGRALGWLDLEPREQAFGIAAIDGFEIARLGQVFFEATNAIHRRRLSGCGERKTPVVGTGVLGWTIEQGDFAIDLFS